MKKWIVAFDMDDVLWPLNVTVTSRLGIPLEKLVDFHAYENPKLTPAEQDAMMAAYSDPDTFRDIQFYPGLTCLPEIEELGVKFEIRSNCYSQAIADLKRAQLQSAIPGLREDQLCLDVITPAETCNKRLPDNLLILVDDSPYNVAKSGARLCVLPMWPYNVTPKARALVSHQPTHYAVPGDLAELSQLVTTLARHLLLSAPAP